MTEPSALSLEACVRARLDCYFADLGEARAHDILGMVVRCVESVVVQVALEKTQGNQTRAADMLGITRGTLRKKMQSAQL